MTLTARQQEIKDEFIRIRKTWAPQWESILRMDCEYLNSYLQLSAVPFKHNYLEDKVKEFIYLAMNVSSTHMFAPGVSLHLKLALDFGATGDELMEVLQLASSVGIHGANVGGRVLTEVLTEQGVTVNRDQDDQRCARLKAAFMAFQGHWDLSWDTLVALDPDFFERYVRFAEVPWKKGPLEPKVKELVLCAIDAAATHLYEPGIKAHMRSAIRYGATQVEIMEMLEIVSVVGIHGALIGGSMLEEALGARARH
ncbi:carboxymuconolactone decarboxylase family protein [Scleromatobacter humisilvae]|uniref:Carboxymuconolactone decarboxylase family protein n=1 Tax=Scleromatobacter humisilvae TaxID=2897159 RepID=A0A9X1YMR0_9BURK|nr:carboxymuconolactone decarboxylase family protein [Scleromatobacter humisilvae]MCK9689424.1 carboxymuconolactone decarboxylase family protein [Scleromatobacter humisilvae]